MKQTDSYKAAEAIKEYQSTSYSKLPPSEMFRVTGSQHEIQETKTKPRLLGRNLDILIMWQPVAQTTL